MTHDVLRSVNSSIGTVRGRPDSEGKKKDLYGNRDNKLKKIFTPKSSKQNSRTLLSW